MSRLRYNRRAATEHLCASCEALGGFIRQQGPLKLKQGQSRDLFAALAESIVYQQLSGKAAGTIHGRFTALFAQQQPNAREAARLSYEQLRAVGLSNNKALAIHDLAARSLDGSLASLRQIARMDDAAVIENLVQVRGIGPWTVQMLLLFNLGRPDIMPATDLGVQKGVQAVYRLEGLPSPTEVIDLTRHLAPYRSAASWYFWRAADTVLMV